MPLVRSALIATAACLIGAAAYAQTTTGDTTPPAGDTTQSMPQTPDNSQVAAPQTSPDMSAQTGTSVNTSATATGGNEVIASQPVPDTPANRAKYGKPLSRAGKRTAPAGN
ncbi:MAG TPA: hypothetical protein VGG29_12620 [Caulobacteraceae bacterium]|jgi:hypothetical protein